MQSLLLPTGTDGRVVMEKIHAPNSSQLVKIPSTPELYDFFNSFILKWLGVPSQRVEKAEDDIQTLPNEHGLLFPEPVPGILVIRTSDGFGQGLAKLAKTKNVPRDLFVEMLVLFWHRFVSTFWRLDSRTLSASLFKKSLPKHWPDRKPDSCLLVFVLQQPIEIRLWLNVTEKERQLWKAR